MAASSVELLVAYAQHQSLPITVIGLSTPPTKRDGSGSPFSDIVKGNSAPGLYSSNVAAQKYFANRKPWEEWDAEIKNALIKAIDTCWAELAGSCIQDISGATVAKLPTASEKIVVPSAPKSEYSNGSFGRRITLCRVDIMTTTPVALSRLQSRCAGKDDLIMVLTGEDDGTQVYDLSPELSATDTAVERPHLSPLNTSSTIYSGSGESIPLSSGSLRRKVEIQRGVPLPLRAASDLVQRPLPPDDTVGVTTVWTSTQDPSIHADVTAHVQEHRPDEEETEVRDTSRPQQSGGHLPTLWDGSGVAPVNSQDLVNLAQDSSVGMVLATPELRIYWVNKRWYEITQIEPGQDLNTWIDNIHPDYLLQVVELLQNLMNGKVKCTGDVKWKNGDWFSFTAQVLTDAQGNVSAVAATIDDCTQRKKLELTQMESLKKEEVAASRRAEDASARTRELVELQSQREVFERRTKDFAQMAEISSIALTCATADGELIWGMSKCLASRERKLTCLFHCFSSANKAFVSDYCVCFREYALLTGVLRPPAVRNARPAAS